MVEATVERAGIARYELEIEIQAAPERVWDALIHRTNGWWLPAFHMVGEGSTVKLEPWAGGRLVEDLEDGGSLLWYTVHWIRPEQRTLYLVGQVAPDWGGPTCSHLKLAVEPRSSGSVLLVADAHYGHIDRENLRSLEEGWTQLFTEGLKAFAEQNGGDPLD